MNKNNRELFIQALTEGLSNRIDQTISEYNVEIKPSKQHMLAMRTIVYGKGFRSKPLSPKARKIIAIFIAAALLLTSCAVIYRNEIRGFIKEITESFTKITHSDEVTEGSRIEEYYEFTYVPDGYFIEKTYVDPTINSFHYVNNDKNELILQQCILDGSSIFVDQESNLQILVIDTYEIYYKETNGKHFYLLNDGKYALKITSDAEIPDEEIVSIINGRKVK